MTKLKLMIKPPTFLVCDTLYNNNMMYAMAVMSVHHYVICVKTANHTKLFSLPGSPNVPNFMAKPVANEYLRFSANIHLGMNLTYITNSTMVKCFIYVRHLSASKK